MKLLSYLWLLLPTYHFHLTPIFHSTVIDHNETEEEVIEEESREEENNEEETKEESPKENKEDESQTETPKDEEPSSLENPESDDASNEEPVSESVNPANQTKPSGHQKPRTSGHSHDNKPDKHETATVKMNTDYPSLSEPPTGNIIESIPDGTEVEILGKNENGWILVKFGEIEGYIPIYWLPDYMKNGEILWKD